MNSLDEAWRWYETTRTQLKLLGRLGRKYWEDLPWEGPLGRDHALSDRDGAVIDSDSEFCLAHLDDLAVLVLFSVFESVVRESVLSEIRGERSRMIHPQVIQIMDDALDGVENGSFGRILETFKGQDTDLVEEVSQVRRYRNWVAHGKRSTRPEMVEPKVAYHRLSQFLSRFSARVS